MALGRVVAMPIMMPESMVAVGLWPGGGEGYVETNEASMKLARMDR